MKRIKSLVHSYILLLLQHHLFNSDIKPPRLSVTFSSKRLEEIAIENKRYLDSVTNAERKYQEEKQRKVYIQILSKGVHCVFQTVF